MAVLQYIGARYVPKFYESSLGNTDWESGVAYEPLTIVTYSGDSYTSKKPVPAGVGNPAANPSFWVATGLYNAQIAALTPLKELALREFATVNDMVNTDLEDGIFAHCATYAGDGQGILYYIQTTADTFTVPLLNGNYANPIINNMCVYASQFGAVGDGVADDTQALQNAIDYAGEDGTVILDRKKCLITSTLEIDHYNFNFVGGEHPEYRNGLYIPHNSGVDPMLRVKSKVTAIRGIQFIREITDRASVIGTGLQIKHPDPDGDSGWYNMDAYVAKCYFMGFNLAADCYGRNMIFCEDTHFSNCKNGVLYHSKNGNQDIYTRGWIVQDCRFHSMGDYLTYNDPDTCPCVAVKTELNAVTREIIIKNNIFDGNCACFMFSGSSDGLIIKGNTVESGSDVVIGLIVRPSDTVNNFPVIKGNVFLSMTQPDLGIYTKIMLYQSGARVYIEDNFFRSNFYSFVKADARSTGISSLGGNLVKGNTFLLNKSNTDFVDSTGDASYTFDLIGNSFNTVGGATGITLGQVGTILNSNKAECNGIHTGISY